MVAMLAQTARRERRLAGGRRAGSFARTKARSTQYDYVHRNWRFLLLTGAGLLSVVLIGSALSAPGFARGAVAGAGTTCVMSFLAFWVVQATGTASTMMGDLAEQWTAKELRSLRGQGWKVVNHLQLRAWDIDHVLIGLGGVFAVETKWSATPWDPADGRMDRHIDQAHRNARDLRLWLRIPEVTPVLMLWGTDSSRRDNYTRRGAQVVMGPHASDWRATLVGSVLTASEVQRTWAKLSDQAAARDPVDTASTPPPSLMAGVSVAVATIALGLLSCAAALWLVRLPGPPAVGLAAQCVLVAAGLMVRVTHRLGRFLLIGARAGVSCGLAVYLGLLLF